MQTKEPAEVLTLPTSEQERIKLFQRQHNQQEMQKHKLGIKSGEIFILAASNTESKSIFAVVDKLTEELEVSKQRIKELEQLLIEERQAHAITAWNLQLEQRGTPK